MRVRDAFLSRDMVLNENKQPSLFKISPEPTLKRREKSENDVSNTMGISISKICNIDCKSTCRSMFSTQVSLIEQKSEDNNIKGDEQTQTEEESKLAQIKAGFQSSCFTHIFFLTYFKQLDDNPEIPTH